MPDEIHLQDIVSDKTEVQQVLERANPFINFPLKNEFISLTFNRKKKSFPILNQSAFVA